MAYFRPPEAQTTGRISVPYALPILPLRQTLAYPFFVLPLTVGKPRSVHLIKEAMQTDRLIGLVGMPDAAVEEPGSSQVYATGTLAVVQHVARTADNLLQVVVQSVERCRIVQWLSSTPYLRGCITLAPDVVRADLELETLQSQVRALAQEVVALSPQTPRELWGMLGQVRDARFLAYLVAASLQLEVPLGQQFLEADTVQEKFRLLLTHLRHARGMLGLHQQVQHATREAMDKAQREYYLRQQLKTIQQELGETDKNQQVVDVYRQKLDAARLPAEARHEALRELARLESLPPQAPEYGLIETYLEWLVALPWHVHSPDQLDIAHARAVLDADHYGLQEVKDRILEYLAVRQLHLAQEDQYETGTEPARQGMPGAILCFAGPPGVGKTSLGQSIARALERKFTRMSLGGVRDDAEIRGHRRTYIGAMPGRIIQALVCAETCNPVFMLDEVDKVGHDWRGDPSSALLEVLDPAQNYAFRDHYLNVNVDLRDVIFIATANQLETIPEPLRDRMEVLQLVGYTEQEKVRIAQDHLVPRQLWANGLRPDQLTFTAAALLKIVRDYARKAGVRNLERQLGAICRKVAMQVTAHTVARVEVTPELVPAYLKQEPFVAEASEPLDLPGITTGLAMTAHGGDILFVEATSMPGKGNLTLTGHLGDIMRESAQIAYSYVRAKARALGLEADLFAQTDLHLHVPAGAIPKDGPSAAAAMVTAMVSLLTARPVRHDVGMTGEITLRGRVLPIGGVKMKVLAAHRAGLTTVILPKHNARDLDDLPDDVRQTMTFVLAEQIDEVLQTALPPSVQGPHHAAAGEWPGVVAGCDKA
jgi:ATP-dependent Lon protease